MSLFQLRRIGMSMEPPPGNPLEVEGVLNPVAVCDPDGSLYLFNVHHRMAENRIGVAGLNLPGAG